MPIWVIFHLTVAIWKTPK